MSDLLEIDRKVREGDDYREYVEVEVDGSDTEVCVRLLYDDEFAHAKDIMGEETFEKLTSDLEGLGEEDREKVQRAQSLAQKAQRGEIDSEEEKELARLKDEVDEVSKDMIQLLDPNLVAAAEYCARCGVVPDEDDVSTIMDMSFSEQESVLGDTAKTREQARELAEDVVIERICEKSREFVATSIGLKVLMSSVGDEGN